MIWEEALWMWMQIRRLLWKQSRDYEWRKINLAWTEGKQASFTVLGRTITLALFKHWLHLDQESDFRVRIGKIFDLGGFLGPATDMLRNIWRQGRLEDTKGGAIFASLVFPIWGVKERKRNAVAEGEKCRSWQYDFRKQIEPKDKQPTCLFAMWLKSHFPSRSHRCNASCVVFLSVWGKCRAEQSSAEDEINFSTNQTSITKEKSSNASSGKWLHYFTARM